MPNPSVFVFVGIGLVTGVVSGVFGIGGGILVVPALIYLAGFPQHVATGTSLAVLLPPVGIAAVLEYYRNGNVNFYAAVVIAVTLTIGGWFGAALANRLSTPYLRLAFGAFVLSMGIYLMVDALKRLGWA